MKVLFVASGNSRHFSVAPFIASMGESLTRKGIELSYYSVVGTGPWDYLRNVGPLRRHLKANDYDVIHAHYSLSGWVAVLAARRTAVVLSLMGDDAQGTFVGEDRISFKSRVVVLLTMLIQPFVAAVISKSRELERAVYRKRISYVIPNGVRLEQFTADEGGSRAELGLREDGRYVLFLGNVGDRNKNFALVQAAVELVETPDVELLPVFGVPHDKVVKYLNSVDVFVLCSFAEGSPNVVKEAMTCNCPMVVTPAGDAARVVEGVEGCYVAGYEPSDFAEKLDAALGFAQRKGRTAGRERIVMLGLDSESVAERVIAVYKKVLTRP